MRGTKARIALDDDTIVAVLRCIKDHKVRARMACVSKTWQACVKRSWDRVHFCFKDEATIRARLNWLKRQLMDHPLELQSLELHSGMPSPSAGQCLYCMGDLENYSRISNVAHAGFCSIPTFTGLGLERFGALRHLDLQSVCGGAPVQLTPVFNGALEAELCRLALQPPAVEELANLAGTLETLRLVYCEDVPDPIVRLTRACLTALLLCCAPDIHPQAQLGPLCCAALDPGRFQCFHQPHRTQGRPVRGPWRLSSVEHDREPRRCVCQLMTCSMQTSRLRIHKP